MNNHGSYSRYKQGCRCDDCRNANCIRQAEANHRRHQRLIAGEVFPPHGCWSTYCNYGCRCEQCRAAARVVNARRTAKAP